MKKLKRKQFLLAGTGVLAGLAALKYATRNTDINVPYPVVTGNEVSLSKNGQSVTIIGGGLSGLMAGCELLDRGFHVTILEKNAMLGGRLTSWRDKDFGTPGKGDWKGHVIEHGTHIVFPFYKNFREFLNRHGLSLRNRTCNYPGAAISFAYPNGMIDDRTASTAVAPFHAQGALRNMKYASKEDNDSLGIKQTMKLLAFDPSNEEEVRYLDNISVKEWMSSIGIRDGIVKAFMDPLMDMATFLPADKTSALYLHRMIGSMFGEWQDLYGVQFFQDSTHDSIIKPLADYIAAKGGKIFFEAEAENFTTKDNRVIEVVTKPLKSKQYICPICGEVHDELPERCRRCGYAGKDFFTRPDSEPAVFHSDHFLLAADIPQAKKLLLKPSFDLSKRYEKFKDKPTSSIVVVYLWYPRKKPAGKGEKVNWEDHFGDRECLMTTDFPYLGTTLNLTYLKPETYAGYDADIIETQIARVDRVKGFTDKQIADKIDEDLRNLIPGLPRYTDVRIMKWDNFTAFTTGAEGQSPEMDTAYDNFHVLGDFVKAQHNCFLMEKVTVNVRRAVNKLLDQVKQKEGKMTILPSETPNYLVDFWRYAESVKA
jgi:uncharacterized protein with NAD-binding domain and iron-sulfur cluster